MTPRVLDMNLPERRSLSVWLWKSVSNSQDLQKAIVAQQLQPEVAIINAALVADLFVVHLAAHKALAAQKRSKLTTKSLHSELVFNVAGIRHISESLKRFGVQPDTKHLLVCRFDADDTDRAAIEAMVHGEAVDLDSLPELRDTAAITKAYKVGPQELQVGSLADAAVMKIAARDC